MRGPHASCRLLATEADPTAYPIHWRGIEPPLTDGAMGSPLLVPFVHEALAGRGPCVADVIAAHSVALAADSMLDEPTALRAHSAPSSGADGLRPSHGVFHSALCGQGNSVVSA